MKTKITLAGIVFFLCSLSSGYSQKLYSSNTGQVGFYAGTPLEDIRAVNNEAESKFLQKNGQIIFSVLVKSFVFKNALMQDHFNENYMESTKFPKADFKGFITNISTVDFTKQGIYSITAAGDLTIHGVTQKVQAAGTLEVKGSTAIVKAKFTVKLASYNVTGNYIGTKIAPAVEISLNCEYE